MVAVSLCIPTYNRKEYLEDTLASVFAQTYKDYEVIVVDDGSTDGTREMMEKGSYGVRYYRQENMGEARTCNRLISLATGRYISFVHSDDLLVPDAIERMVNTAEADGGNVIVYGNYFRIDEAGNVLGRCKRKLHSGYITPRLFEDIIVHPVGSLFPRKALEEVGGLDISLEASYDYKIELQLSLRYRFIALDEPTFMRRRHRSNNSQDSFANRKAELDVLLEFYCGGGGKDVVPRRIAMKRLSKESYRAGLWALREGLQQEACRCFRQSFYRRPNIKSVVWLGLAAISPRLC